MCRLSDNDLLTLGTHPEVVIVAAEEPKGSQKLEWVAAACPAYTQQQGAWVATRHPSYRLKEKGAHKVKKVV